MYGYDFFAIFTNRTGTTFVTLSSMGNEVLPKWFKRNPFLIGKLVHPYHSDVSVSRFRSLVDALIFYCRRILHRLSCQQKATDLLLQEQINFFTTERKQKLKVTKTPSIKTVPIHLGIKQPFRTCYPACAQR